MLKRDELRLYTLIWERFVASQMAAAVYDQTTVDIAAMRHAGYLFRATGSVMNSPALPRLRRRQRRRSGAAEAAAKDGKAVACPSSTKAMRSTRHGIDPKQHFTEPPPRYTEATLVKALEENGIGRPSTYSSIVETIQARGYVEQDDRRFKPTDIGIAVNDLLPNTFADIMDLTFTAKMECELDQVGGQRRLGRRFARLLRPVRDTT